MPETYIIFITSNDVLKGGLPVYTIERTIQETGEQGQGAGRPRQGDSRRSRGAAGHGRSVPQQMCIRDRPYCDGTHAAIKWRDELNGEPVGETLPEEVY